MLLLLPLVNYAQYTGGNGRGDGSLAISGKYLSNCFYVDGNWSTTSCWQNEALPASNETAIVRAVATVDGAYTYADLTIESIGSVTISPEKSLTITGNLSNEGTFTINSDATTSGSLTVAGTSTGNLTYNRYMTGSNTNPWVWHLVSSPVIGQALNSAYMSANSIATNGTKHGLAPYNNDTPGWAHYSTESDPSTTFTTAKGYEIARTAAGTVAFTGTVAVDNVTIGITFPSGKSPWNLVGNPYPSAICANTPATTATTASENLILKNASALGDGAYQAVYVWDANAGTPKYEIINHTYNGSTAFYVAPGQAFFVYSKEESGSFSITEAMQTHQVGDIFKASQSSYPEIKLKVESEYSSHSTQIKYIEGTTLGLDPGYDAGVFDGTSSDLMLSSRLLVEHPVRFGIQCLPDTDYENMPIPIELHSSMNSTVVFTADLLNLPSDMKVYLEDQLNNTMTLLDEDRSSYSTTTFEGNSEGRFVLHTTRQFLAIDDITDESEIQNEIIVDYTSSIIRITGILDDNAEVFIYDLSGRILYQKVLNGSNEFKVPSLNTGIYIVKLINSGLVISQKMYRR